MTNMIPITRVVQISVSSASIGLSSYNTSNLALFTSDTPSPAYSGAYKIYFTASEVAVDFPSASATVAMANAIFSQQPNILNNSGYLVIIPFLTLETLQAAIIRTSALVSYFGVISTRFDDAADNLLAATTIQTLNMIGFFPSYTSADLASNGSIGQFATNSLTQSRGLFYDDSSTVGAVVGLNALVMAAAYASRGLSVNFTGSNTTITMHLKTLIGVAPDPNITNTLLTTAIAAGCDTYVSLQGVPAVFTSGLNFFYDRVYNLQWFVGALQVNGFNYLAQSSTKIPQTESGMDGLKNAYGQICQQAVNNQYIAPGVWTSPDTFGNQQNFFNNIQQFGYYLYSTPIGLQIPADRAARKAPLVQIAIKEAGAIQSSNVLIFVNP